MQHSLARYVQEVHDVLGDAVTAIAAAVTFLVSDDASDLTGSTLAVGGGRL
ncbi:hypothetical protein [Nostoc sp.]|uniref:hypothetical protein n=1 Tax=Nostoc sp. TaxID=1180 RepID=UPI002FF9FFF5